MPKSHHAVYLSRAEWRKDHFSAEEIELLEREEKEWRQDQAWIKDPRCLCSERYVNVDCHIHGAQE